MRILRKALWLTPLVVWGLILVIMKVEMSSTRTVTPPPVLPFDVTVGSPKAWNTLYVYEAPSCGFCEKWDANEKSALGEKGQDVRVIYRTIAPEPGEIDMAIERVCAASGKGLVGSCITDPATRQAIIDNTRNAKKLGIVATPSFVLNTHVMVGYRNADQLLSH